MHARTPLTRQCTSALKTMSIMQRHYVRTSSNLTQLACTTTSTSSHKHQLACIVRRQSAQCSNVQSKLYCIRDEVETVAQYRNVTACTPALQAYVPSPIAT